MVQHLMGPSCHQCVNLIVKAVFLHPPGTPLSLPPFSLSSARSPPCAGDQERLANHQHQHHEGRLQRILVCPDCRVPVLVQRRGGERKNSVPVLHFTGHTWMWLAKIDDTAPQECGEMKILSLALLLLLWLLVLGHLVPSAAVVGGVCVPAQPNQCADYCSAVA